MERERDKEENPESSVLVAPRFQDGVWGITTDRQAITNNGGKFGTEEEEPWFVFYIPCITMYHRRKSVSSLG